MALGNKEIVDLPVLVAIAGADLYVTKSDADYRSKVGGPNGLAWLDETGKLPSSLVGPGGTVAHTHAAGDVTSGVFATARLGVGTANSTSYLRGDGQWVALPSTPVEWASVLNKPSTFTPSAHAHDASAIVSGILATARLGTGTPSTSTFLRGDGQWVAVNLSGGGGGGGPTSWNAITDKPATFPPTAHTHAASDITSGVLAVARLGNGTATSTTYLRGDGIWATIGASAVEWANVLNKPSSFTPSAHTHTASDITSGVLGVARLGTGTASATTFLRGDGTWATVSAQGVSWDNISNKPSTFTPSAHTHSAADVTSGVFDVARIPDIAQAKVIGLGATLATKVDSSGSGFLPSDANIHVGFGMGNIASPSSNTPTGSWTTMVNAISTDGTWGFQLAHPWFSDEIYYRAVNNGSRGAYRQLYHSGNFDPATKVTNGGSVATITQLTQAAYNALGTKDANTLYVIVG